MNLMGSGEREKERETRKERQRKSSAIKSHLSQIVFNTDQISAHSKHSKDGSMNNSFNDNSFSNEIAGKTFQKMVSQTTQQVSDQVQVIKRGRLDRLSNLSNSRVVGKANIELGGGGTGTAS